MENETYMLARFIRLQFQTSGYHLIFSLQVLHWPETTEFLSGLHQ